jgi:hypothetical protein
MQTPPVRKPRQKKPGEDMSRDGGLNGDGGVANPDPAVFEAAFVIDDNDDTMTPALTPPPQASTEKKEAAQQNRDSTQDASKATDSEPQETSEPAKKGEPKKDAGDKPTTAEQSANAPATAPAELPLEVRGRLRKLEKLEKTYPGSQSHELVAFHVVHLQVTPLTLASQWQNSCAHTASRIAAPHRSSPSRERSRRTRR